MKLFLQFGHGMKALTLDLSKKWHGTSVILSPRDMTPNQLTKWSKDFEKAGVDCYFDPQCYCPQGRQKSLAQYAYWDCDLNTHLQSDSTKIDEQIKNIKMYNDIAKTKAYIVPSILNNYDSDWADQFINQSKRFIDSAHKVMIDKPIYTTLTLPKAFLIQHELTIEPVLQEFLEMDVTGYYVIAEALDRKYLIDNPMWLSNVFHICATLKIAGTKLFMDMEIINFYRCLC